MKNYKALKSANKISVKKTTVTVKEAVDVVKYKDGDTIPSDKKIGDVRIEAQDAETKDVYSTISKVYDPNTGEVKDDLEKTVDINMIDTEINSFKAQISRLQSKQADFEQLKKDLEAH